MTTTGQPAPSSDVTIERVDRTLVVTIQRPDARNALTRGVLLAITKAFTDAAADAGVRCVVLTGSGGHFCAGADLRRSFADDPNLMDNLEGYLDVFHGVVYSIVRCPKPTIAAMDGCAVGFGADMALACDFRIATTVAYLQEKFVNIGLMPDGGGTFWLPRLIGTARAMKAIMLSDKLESSTLEELGLLIERVPPEELREATLRLAKRIERGPPLAFAAVKSAVYANLGDLEEALRREREGQLRLLRSSDCLEGILAWSERREPDFKGM